MGNSGQVLSSHDRFLLRATTMSYFAVLFDCILSSPAEILAHFSLQIECGRLAGS